MGLKEREAALNHRLKATKNDEAVPGSKLRCECADLRCNAMLELTDEERARRTARGSWFWVKPGHEPAHVAQVLEQSARFSVVRLESPPI
jgi:hypothetical protein